MENRGDIFLIGEQHTSEDHARAQQEIIEDIQPDIVLREGFNNRGWGQIEDDVERIGQTYSLQRLEETLEDEYGIETGPTEDTYEDIAQTPWPDLDPADVLTLADRSEETARELEDDGYSPEADPIMFLETAAEKYRLYHDVMQSPSSTAVHRSMAAVHDLRQDGAGTTIRGCDIDKQAYLEDMTDEEIEEAFMSDELIEAREDTMAGRIAEAADERDSVIGIIGRYHHRGVRERLEAEGYDVDGGIMPGTSGKSEAYRESVIAQYD